MKKNPSSKYYVLYDDFKKIELNTEFSPNETVIYKKIDYIDFNISAVVLLNGRKIYFDGLSEDMFIHVCNGGYYEDLID